MRREQDSVTELRVEKVLDKNGKQVLATQGATVANSATAVPAAAPAGGTGAAAGGWDTAANRDAAITTINGLRTVVIELQTQLNSALAQLRAHGLIAT